MNGMRAALQPLECGISPTTRPLTLVDRRPDPPCATAKYSLPDAAVAELRDLFGAKQYVFGQGHRQRLVDMWGIVNSFSVPIDAAVARQGDSGVPFVKAFPGEPPPPVSKREQKEVYVERSVLQTGS